MPAYKRCYEAEIGLFLQVVLGARTPLKWVFTTPVRACFGFGLVLCIGAMVPAIIVIRFRMLVRRALRRFLCGPCSEGVRVDDVGLE